LRGKRLRHGCGHLPRDDLSEVAVAAGSTMGTVIMGIWTVVLSLVQGNIEAPAVHSRTTSIHPAIVLLAIPAASAVAGILGIFIVVPAIGVVAATWRTVLAVIGGDPMPAAPTRNRSRTR
jgi:predicted PurR-regulated permease PerM